MLKKHSNKYIGKKILEQVTKEYNKNIDKIMKEKIMPDIKEKMKSELKQARGNGSFDMQKQGRIVWKKTQQNNYIVSYLNCRKLKTPKPASQIKVKDKEIDFEHTSTPSDKLYPRMIDDKNYDMKITDTSRTFRDGNTQNGRMMQMYNSTPTHSSVFGTPIEHKSDTPWLMSEWLIQGSIPVVPPHTISIDKNNYSIWQEKSDWKKYVKDKQNHYPQINYIKNVKKYTRELSTRKKYQKYYDDLLLEEIKKAVLKYKNK